MTRDNDNITCAVKRLSNKFRRRIFSDEMREKEFSHGGGRILHFLLEKNMKGETIYQKDIQDRFGMRASSASSHIKKLEEKGLIKRVSDPDDRRLKKIVPTEKLLANSEYIEKRSRDLNDKITRGIDKNDIDTFMRVIDMMIKNMEDDE